MNEARWKRMVCKRKVPFKDKDMDRLTHPMASSLGEMLPGSFYQQHSVEARLLWEAKGWAWGWVVLSLQSRWRKDALACPSSSSLREAAPPSPPSWPIALHICSPAAFSWTRPVQTGGSVSPCSRCTGRIWWWMALPKRLTELGRMPTSFF